MLRELTCKYINKMRGINSMLLLITCFYNLLLASSGESVLSHEPKCFQYTWIGSHEDPNCEKIAKNIPCMPLYSSDKNPDTVEVWNNITKSNEIETSKYLCGLKPDSVCIRYTYIYNDAVVNVSYFCGKVIEDQTLPITSGCYAQYIEGYTIEACTCRSRYNTTPCNSSVRNTYSISIVGVITIVPLFMYMKIFDIP